MDRRQIVLAALATAKGAPFTPVQVQKLLFLVDREIPNYIGGPFFDFQPYDYGPFDSMVYTTLDALHLEGLVSIDPCPAIRWRRYRLTPAGQAQGEAFLHEVPSPAREFIEKISTAVRSMGFAQLVSAIYRKYPEMKSKSIFKG